MKALSKIEDLHWIRILYAYPSYFSDDLIDEIATNPKVLANICSPGDSARLCLVSCSDVVLKMRHECYCVAS